MASFLQSPEWQEVQERMGRPTRRIRNILLIRHDIPLGFHYLYAPRPAALSAEFLSDALEQARRDGAIFLKIDPLSALSASSPLIHDSKFTVREGHALQPDQTLLVDCRQTDALLFAAMRPKTRYNIRLAERHGLAVRAADPATGRDFEAFFVLLEEASRRDGFHLHPREHYQALLTVRSADFSNTLFLAERDGVGLAAAVVNAYRPAATATYLHGGSNWKHRALMAPYLLHWQIIRHARALGLAWYDFGGIDEVRWPGLTRFKAGFGGERREYPPSADYVVRFWPYALYRLQRRLRHGREA